jgi:hypothetical protein
MRKSSTRAELVARLESARKALASGQTVGQDPEMLQLAARLDAGTQRLSDVTYFATRDVSNQTSFKFFQPQDVKDKGLCNVANAQLDKNNVIMVGSIVLLGATSTSAISGNRETLASLNYGGIDAPALISGELTFRYHGKNVLDELPITRFVTSDDKRNQIGELVLDNPILIRENDPIEVNIETGTPLPDKTALRILLVGCGVVSN